MVICRIHEWKGRLGSIRLSSIAPFSLFGGPVLKSKGASTVFQWVTAWLLDPFTYIYYGPTQVPSCDEWSTCNRVKTHRLGGIRPRL